MIVMPSNNTGFEAGRLFERFDGRLAHLHSVDGKREPKPGVDWALDNGVYGAFTSGSEWREEPFYKYLEEYASWSPLWAVVPDWVGDKKRTLSLWEQHYPAVSAFGVPLAFAVQDGMTEADLPGNADVIFVGGSFSWKWRNLNRWTNLINPKTGELFPVHVGRVNSYRLLWQAHKSGAVSCDGTGWFRGGPKRLQSLINYLEESAGGEPFQREFDL